MKIVHATKTEKQNEKVYQNFSINRFLNSISTWKFLTLIAVFIFFGLSVRWSLIDNSPPAWDQGLYLYQSALLHNTLAHDSLWNFFTAIFSLDPGRVPFLPVMAQPAFYLFGPSLDAAVISLNFFWFLLVWAIFGVARATTGSGASGDKAGFFAFVLFAICPMTTMLSNNFLVELPFVSFISASVYSLWLTHKTQKKKWVIISGIFIAFGMLTKVTFPAFFFPAFVLLLYKNIRTKSLRSTIFLFLPSITLPLIIAGPYYLYNFRQIFALTLTLSSRNLADLYNFGGAFNLQTVGLYLYNVMVNPAMLVALFLATMLLASKFINTRNEYKEEQKYSPPQKLMSAMLILWFVVPFLLATFGEIKDPRYLYPSLIPLFVFAGISISHFFKTRLLFAVTILLYLLPVSEYLYAQGLLGEKSASKIRPIVKTAYFMYPQAQPDPRNWKAGELVHGIGQNLGAQKENKNVFFLGGNRYYHLRLLDFEGLIGKFHLTYIVLPYYSDPSMSVKEAVQFIKDKSPAGILYKSGENWPEFSSRLDSQIVSHFKTAENYKAIDLAVEQPDGSHFTLLVPVPPRYFPVSSVNDISGDWKAGDGIAHIEQDSKKNLILASESGNRENFKIQDGIILIPSWNVSGNLTEDKKYIIWSNGFRWEKIPLPSEKNIK